MTGSITVLSLDEKAAEYLERSRLADPAEWKDPDPIGNSLLPVPAMDPGLLPQPLQSWAADVAERMDKMPVEFPAIAIVSALGGVIGRRVAIHPKQFDNWLVVPNLWGAVVGRPSVKKSPALAEALRFPRLLEEAAEELYQASLIDFAADQEADVLHRKAMESDLKKAAKTDKAAAKKMLLAMGVDEGDAPTRTRYIVNDTTIEKLGEILRENPNGLLLFRDELVGWLASLEREGREQDRAFFLESWNGTGSFTWDRIGRGTVHVPSVCLSILGGIQPAKLVPYLRSMASGTGDDGLLQRFQLLVWPDAGRPVHVDRACDQVAWDKVRQLFKNLAQLEAGEGDQRAIRFDADAQLLFDEWYAGMLEKEHEESNPFIESHLTKYHSLMPSLALIFHHVEGSGDAVGDIATTRAIAWCTFLEAHARRVYALATDPRYGARSLLRRLTDLPNPFSKDHLNKRDWSGLTTASEINAAIGTLLDSGDLKQLLVRTGTKPKAWFYKNPHTRSEGENYENV